MMFPEVDEPETVERRDVLRIGAISLFTGGMASIANNASAANFGMPKSGSAEHCIYILLQGGPSHLDLWDPKPDAPAEVRGPFKTIGTSLSGVRFGELLKRSAKIADQIAIVRSMTHKFNNHIAGTYITLTGSDNQPNRDREADANDFPGPGAVLNYLKAGSTTSYLKAGSTTSSKHSSRGSTPTSISLPNWLSIPGPSNRMPGQYGGFLGSVHDPLLVSGEPQKKDFKARSMTLPKEISPERVQSRYTLLKTLDRELADGEPTAIRSRSRYTQSAFELLTDPKVRNALDLTRESDKVRDAYGRSKIGQSLLLARRLVEAGVRFVSYNVFNQGWDHHGNIRKALEGRVPAMEKGFAALVDDLRQRGMLDKTLVINTGEFGRTPKMNNKKGRDHWPDVYSTVLAGGGIRGGRIVGRSDAQGAYVHTRPTAPADILATMWHLMGIDPRLRMIDRIGRSIALTKGQVVSELL